VIDAIRARWRGLSHVNVGVPVEGGHLDRVDVEPSGRIRLTGWTENGAASRLECCRETVAERGGLDGSEIRRADLTGLAGGLLHRVRGPHEGVARRVTVQSSGREVAHLEPLLPLQPAALRHLARRGSACFIAMTFTGSGRHCRSQARGGGVRTRTAGTRAGFRLAAAARWSASLRAAGVETFGIELRRAEIEASLKDDVKPVITLYDGKLPMPYPGWPIRERRLHRSPRGTSPTMCMPRRKWRRVARLALITVPDMSANPRTVSALGRALAPAGSDDV